MPPPMAPKTSLSKGTLGLKFMNRQVPASPASSVASTPGRGTPAPASAAKGAKGEKKEEAAQTPVPAAGGRMSFGGSAAAAQQNTAEEADEDWGSRRVAGKGSRPTVIHESSLLSFPLLSSSFSSFSTSTSSSSSTFTGSSSYSSMPLTSSTVSGRRSFGGANVEIEKLNDPNSHREEPKDGPGGETNAQRKKRLKAERDAAPVSVRRGGGSTLSSAKTGRKTAALEKRRADDGRADETGSAKKRRLEAAAEGGAAEMDPMRWEADDDEVALPGAGKKSKKSAAGLDVPDRAAPLKKGEFARPGGFEGAKKAKGKGKGVMGDYKWGKEGDVREWDEDKEVGDSSEDDSEDDEAFMRALDADAAAAEEGADDDEDEDDASSDESGSEVEEMLVKGKKAVGGKGKAARTKAVEREEARFVGGGGRGKGKKARR
ncbi:hypothetical protein JCM6882_005847 [Rhodosporidiobolus microsporus]